jgi:hypothetical protein
MKQATQRATTDRIPTDLAWRAQSLWHLAAAKVTAIFVVAALVLFRVEEAGAKGCEFWVAPYPVGDDLNSGSIEEPWATIEHASHNLPNETCTVWVMAGTYYGEAHLVERYEHPVTFKAVEPYKAIFENQGTVLNFDGARNIVIEGFIVRHSGRGSRPQVIKVDRSSRAWSEHITFRNNIIHDSYNDDLLKIYFGVRYVTVEGNIFFNQSNREEHIDVNGVTDITIQDNIFFNNFAGSGRNNERDAKSFITIKDSNGDLDDQLGSERIYVRRNIFLNWEGGKETFIQVGNDGKPYFEAKDIWIENNLFIGNGRDTVYASLGVRGVQNLVFTNNTIVGDLPATAYAMWVSTSGGNPRNENIRFYNNIWADPTGSMGAELGSSRKFSNGNPNRTEHLVLENNLYWNGDKNVPRGDLVSPRKDDPKAILADPLINVNHEGIVLPRWDGSEFLSGSTTIRHEFIRLVELYGKPQADSPVIDVADPKHAPADDILGRERVGAPDIGAYEYYPVVMGGATLTEIRLQWPLWNTSLVTQYAISYTDGQSEQVVRNIPANEQSYTLTDLVPYTIYTITVTALDDVGRVVAKSMPLVLMTTDAHLLLPYMHSSVDWSITALYAPLPWMSP